MELKFYDPLQSKSFTVQGVEPLVEHLALLPGKHHIKFLNTPFPLDETLLKDLNIQTQHESIKNRYTFECTISPAALTPKAADALNKMRMTHINVDFDPMVDFSDYASMFKVGRMSNLGLILNWAPSTESKLEEDTLAKAYHFLQDHLGLYRLNLPPNAFLAYDSKVSFYYGRLSRTSQDFTPIHRFNRHLNERFYMMFYEYLRQHFSHHVKTLLEIHPHGESRFFSEFNYQSYPWKVVKLPLENNQLPIDKLQALGKTFDGIVLFQALESMKDPKKDLLVLQNYARHTTEWAVMDYNFQSLPMLFQLMTHSYNNGILLSNHFERLKLISPHSVHKMFEFLGVHFNLQPLYAETDEFAQQYRQIAPILDQEFPNQDIFKQHHNTMAFMGVGTMLMGDDPFGGDGFSGGEGFISGGEGFLSGFNS